MRFTKMHGLGNDFVVIDARCSGISDPAALAKRVCRRRFGIGADGMILVCESEHADIRMRYFNSDGSEAICGNGLRCFGKYVYDTGIVHREHFTAEVISGTDVLDLNVSDGLVSAVRADMGRPLLRPEEIPVLSGSNRVSVVLDGQPVRYFCVSMGNPHAVTFDIFPGDADFLRLGAKMEHDPLFPEAANIEFCRVDGPNDITVKVWERGDGPTLACGTGSCAVLAAAVSLGLTEKKAAIHLPGGTLQDEWAEDGHIYMTGPAETVYTGEFIL